MMYYGNGMGLGWSLILLAAVALPLLLIAGALLAPAIRRAPDATAASATPPEAERVLADRLARGEIDTEEYETRLRALRATQR